MNTTKNMRWISVLKLKLLPTTGLCQKQDVKIGSET